MTNQPPPTVAGSGVFAAGAGSAVPPHRSTAGNVTATILLSVLLLIGGIAMALTGLLGAAFASDACVHGSCELVSLGFALAVFGPLAWTLAAVVPSIVLMALRRTAWWIPLAGLGGATLTWLIGTALMSA